MHMFSLTGSAFYPIYKLHRIASNTIFDGWDTNPFPRIRGCVYLKKARGWGFKSNDGWDYILLSPCDTPDGNDVLITNLPTSIPESDLRVSTSRISWSYTAGLTLAYLCCVYVHLWRTTVVWIFTSKLNGMYRGYVYQENHPPKGEPRHCVADQRNVRHTVGSCSTQDGTTIGKPQNPPGRRFRWVVYLYIMPPITEEDVEGSLMLVSARQENQPNWPSIYLFIKCCLRYTMLRQRPAKSYWTVPYAPISLSSHPRDICSAFIGTWKSLLVDFH